jgi:hypothetical protein
MAKEPFDSYGEMLGRIKEINLIFKIIAGVA